MFVIYRGPHTGGLQQIGRFPVTVVHGEPVDLPDELAKAMLDQYPDDWETAPTSKKSKSGTAAAAGDSQESSS